MKKLLSIFLGGFFLALLTGGFFILQRYRSNPESVFPYPYEFTFTAPAVELEAPVLIIGDRMGEQLARYKQSLEKSISRDLEKPIRVHSLARKGEALHRTLHTLRSVGRWPHIVIYQGGSEEFAEQKFEPSEIGRIRENFSRYQDERIQTLLMLYPQVSRVVYEPLRRTRLEEAPKPRRELSEDDFLKVLDTELLLFEQQLRQLVNLAKDRNSLLVLTTTPVNLDVKPRAVCEFTADLDLEKGLLELGQLIAAGNFKSAYSRSSKLVAQYRGHAQLFHIHSQIARQIGNQEEAVRTGLEASAFDCRPWRATELQNSIIRRVARENQVMLFDFALLVEQDWGRNVTFFDEIYPQNLYYQRAMDQLGLVIKQILKL